MVDRDTWLPRVLERLLDGQPSFVTLDQIGEAIGTDPVTPEDIEQLFQELEGRHVKVGHPDQPDLPALLRQVLGAARELKQRGIRPSPREVAQHSGLSPRSVRVALLYADVLRG